MREEREKGVRLSNLSGQQKCFRSIIRHKSRRSLVSLSTISVETLLLRKANALFERRRTTDSRKIWTSICNKMRRECARKEVCGENLQRNKNVIRKSFRIESVPIGFVRQGRLQMRGTEGKKWQRASQSKK